MKLPNYRIPQSRDIECCPALAQEDNTFSWGEKLRFPKKKRERERFTVVGELGSLAAYFEILFLQKQDKWRWNQRGDKSSAIRIQIHEAYKNNNVKQGFQNTLDKSLLWKHCPFAKESESWGIWITSSFFPQEPPTLTLARGELREQVGDRESLRNYCTAFVLAGITQLQTWSICPSMFVVLVITICLFPLWLLPTWISWGHFRLQGLDSIYFKGTLSTLFCVCFSCFCFFNSCCPFVLRGNFLLFMFFSSVKLLLYNIYYIWRKERVRERICYFTWQWALQQSHPILKLVIFPELDKHQQHSYWKRALQNFYTESWCYLQALPRVKLSSLVTWLLHRRTKVDF